MADIEKLRKLLAEALAKETPESLEKWLKSIGHDFDADNLDFIPPQGIHIYYDSLCIQDNFI